MEFLIVPLLFGIALILLSIGKLFGKKEGLQTSCHASKNINEVHGSCGACSTEEAKFCGSENDPGFTKVVKPAYPNQKKRFNDKYDFRPERFN